MIRWQIEERYSATPWPERRLRVKFFGLWITLWSWLP